MTKNDNIYNKTDEPSPCLPCLESLGKVGIISLGCSKNRVNTEQMMFLLSSAGYEVSGDISGADVVLLNTCGFIESAKAEAVETIIELLDDKKDGSIGKLVVAGCYPERYKETILEELPEIDAVIGTGSFDDVVDVIKKAQHLSPCFFGDINAPVSETPRILSTSSAWAYLKIAEGCDNRCAYCCIPDIRGKFRSRMIENIVDEAKRLADNGIRELIVVAQDVTMYGLDVYGKRRLSDLLLELNKIDKLNWIRLHYLYPDEFDDELIDVIAKSGKILKYLDIPIQHISDIILNKMRRRGSGLEIRELIKRLREQIPGVVIRTSLITGLPGEGEDEFNEICEFLREYELERVGVFAYSPEEGTDAALMERPSKEIAENRADELLELQSYIMQKWNESRIGTVTDVIFEDIAAEIDGKVYNLARSFAESPEIDGYILVEETQRQHPYLKTGEMFSCRITGIFNGELIGELI